MSQTVDWQARFRQGERLTLRIPGNPRPVTSIEPCGIGFILVRAESADHSSVLCLDGTDPTTGVLWLAGEAEAPAPNTAALFDRISECLVWLNSALDRSQGEARIGRLAIKAVKLHAEYAALPEDDALARVRARQAWLAAQDEAINAISMAEV
jgi:hypothetical protein